jgi:hypothetical protein
MGTVLDCPALSRRRSSSTGECQVIGGRGIG